MRQRLRRPRLFRHGPQFSKGLARTNCRVTIVKLLAAIAGHLPQDLEALSLRRWVMGSPPFVLGILVCKSAYLPQSESSTTSRSRVVSLLAAGCASKWINCQPEAAL